MAIEPDYTSQGGFWEDLYRAWSWRNEQGLLHRVDGPAAIHENGSQWWYRHGRRHRVDGPAVIYPDGRCEWWLHAQRHRVDGPAMIYPAGTQRWYVQDQNITAEVEAWMAANSITWPFAEAQQMEFALRWL